MRKRSIWLIPISAVTMLYLAACASGRLSSLPQEEGLHPRLTRSAFIEEGKLVSLVVDTDAARLRDKQAIFPLGITVANHGLPRLTLTRESFTLVDEKGNRYPMASVGEGRKLGGLQTLDLRLSRTFFEVMNGRFTSYIANPTVFFPLNFVDPHDAASASRGVVVEHAELPKFSYSEDLIYFPHPSDTIIGKKFELWLDTEELDPPVFVKFRIQP